VKHVLKALGATAQQAPRPLHTGHGPTQLRGWKTIKELSVELRFDVTAPGDPEDATRAWLRRQRPPIATVRRGRVILVDDFDIQRALQKRAV